jgi:hypothetical protein
LIRTIQDAVELQPEVVMELPGRVLLDAEAPAAGPSVRTAARLRRLLEVALAEILV